MECVKADLAAFPPEIQLVCVKLLINSASVVL